MSTPEVRPITVDPALASAAVAAVGHAIVTTDSHGYVTFWNRAAERIRHWTVRVASRGPGSADPERAG
jgi:PAS domain-containing protein